MSFQNNIGSYLFYILLLFIALVIVFINLYYLFKWIVTVHKNANIINGSKIVPWNPILTGLSLFVPVLSKITIYYIFYKILKVSSSAKITYILILSFIVGLFSDIDADLNYFGNIELPPYSNPIISVLSSVTFLYIVYTVQKVQKQAYEEMVAIAE